jgi:HlyD family secretion protein
LRLPGRLPGYAVSVVGLILVARCAGVEADRRTEPGRSVSPSDELVLRRGSFENHLLLTGTLEAVRSTQITAPSVPTGQLQIRWMEEDGAFVTAGQKVLEFDNSAFASDLEDKKLAARKKAKDLRRAEAEARAEAAEKEFTVEQRRVAVAKARLEADVPEGILPLRELQEKQLALERARTELDKARQDLEAYRGTKGKELALSRLELDKTRYEIRVAEEAIEALVLEAPLDGVLVVGEIPWEGRKLQEGDSVWPGFPLLKIPDLDEMRVTARLSDVDDGRIDIGMTATVTLDAYPDETFEGTVASITPVAQETSPRSLRRGFAASMNLLDTDPDRMRPGMAAKVDVRTDARDDVLLAPRATLDLSHSPPLVRLASGETQEVSLAGCNLFECVVESGQWEP